MVIQYTQMEDVTNRIIYNRLLRACFKILQTNVFELNDTFTREKIDNTIRNLLMRAKSEAIQDFTLFIKPFDPANPHYIEVHVVLWFKNMIHQVLLNVNNLDINT